MEDPATGCNHDDLSKLSLKRELPLGKFAWFLWCLLVFIEISFKIIHTSIDISPEFDIKFVILKDYLKPLFTPTVVLIFPWIN